jgi:hypothetical protein
MATTGRIKSDAACNGTDRRRRQMELGKHRDDSGTHTGAVMAIPAGLSIHEREESDGVARPDPAQRLAAAGEDGCDDELQASTSEPSSRVEGAP